VSLAGWKRPIPTERLDQANAGFHATTQDIDIVALIRERGGLPGDDLQVGILTPDVAVGEEAQRAFSAASTASRCCCTSSRRMRSAARLSSHLLKRCERSMPVRRNRGIVSRPRYLRLGMTSAAVEQFLRQ
jgi:hypothetical protein